MKVGVNPFGGGSGPANRPMTSTSAAKPVKAPVQTHRVTQEPLSALRRHDNAGPMFSESGDMNAHGKKDAHLQGEHLRRAMASGAYHTNWLSVSAQVTGIDLSTRALRQEALHAAMADGTMATWHSVSSAIAMLISEQQKREGFVRRLMSFVELNVGDVPRMGTPRREVTAVTSAGISSVEFQEIRNREVMPKEVTLTTNVRVQNLHLQQTSGDLLEEGYNQSIEAIMVKEDRLWKAAADEATRLSGSQAILSGQWNPALLAATRQLLLNAGYGMGTMLIGSDVANSQISNPLFFDMYDPVTKYEILQTGVMGSILGMDIVTDASRLKNLKVLEPGDVYITAPPDIHGGYTDRGGVVATPVDGAQTGSSSKGWFVEENFSLAILDPITVVKARLLA